MKYFNHMIDRINEDRSAYLFLTAAGFFLAITMRIRTNAFSSDLEISWGQTILEGLVVAAAILSIWRLIVVIKALGKLKLKSEETKAIIFILASIPVILGGDWIIMTISQMVEGSSNMLILFMQIFALLVICLVGFTSRNLYLLKKTDMAMATGFWTLGLFLYFIVGPHVL